MSIPVLLLVAFINLVLLFAALRLFPIHAELVRIRKALESGGRGDDAATALDLTPDA